MREKLRRRLLPISVFVVCTALSLLLWHSSRLQVERNLRNLLDAQANLVSGLLTGRIESMEFALVRTARRWAAGDGAATSSWQGDARALMAEDPAAINLSWINPDGAILWQVDETATTRPLSTSEKERLEAAKATREVAVSDLVDSGGKRSVFLYVPMYIGSRFDGFLAEHVDFSVLLDAIYRRAAINNIVEIERQDTLIYRQGPAKVAHAEGIQAEHVAPVNGLAFNVRILPGRDFLRANAFGLPRFLLLGGLLITLLATCLAFLRAQVARRSRDLRAAQQLISDNERRYADLLLRARIGFTVTDAQGRVIQANRPYAQMAGFERVEDILGQQVRKLLHPNDHARFDRLIANPAKAPPLLQEEVVFTHPTGAQRVVDVTTMVDMTDVAGPRLVSLCRDVTESTRARAEILEGKRIFEGVFENSDVAISDIDFSYLFKVLQHLKQTGVVDLRAWFAERPERLDEICRNTILNNINRAGLQLFGAQSVAELAGMDYFLQSDRSTQVREVAFAIWNGQETLRREALFSTFTGKDLAIIYSLRLPKTAVEAKRVPVVTIDISDVRSAETAKRANVAKSQFLASMSHEIRTPLNGVIGNLELMAQTELSEEQEDLLFDAEKAAKSLLALIGNILDFSKIEAGKLTLEHIELNPAAIVQEAVDIVQSRARQKGIFVTSSFASDVPLTVKGDPTRIRQILLNLLGNAVKFTVHGGVHVSLSVKDWDDSICQLLFSVHDSGRGFHQSLVPTLFQPFTQDYKHTAEDLEGTGLGLSICKSLVDSFGGEFECQSAPDEGASFWFTLPVQVVKPADAPKPSDLTGRSVLFINAVASNLPPKLTHYLAVRGATLYTAPDREEALQLCRKALGAGGRMDVAIHMGRPEDWPVAKYSSALREYHVVPTVLAPDASSDLWRRALASGASFLLTDETGEEFLDRNLGQVLGGHSDILILTDQTAAIDAEAIAGKHVLVVEDRLINQTIIQRQLRRLGVSCSVAGDGIAGLDRLTSGRFDLILCDCSMPEMNGYEFTRILRSREAERGDGRHIPVIAMTANAFREDMEKCFAAGMDDFLSKPVTLQRLASVLVRWVKESAAAQAALALPACEVKSIEAIDLGVLEDLLGTSDRDVVADILHEFIGAAHESWSEVQLSAETGDSAAIARAVHGAKGEARNAGAVILGELYEELERFARDSDRDGMDRLFATIPKELRRVEHFAREMSGSTAR